MSVETRLHLKPGFRIGSSFEADFDDSGRWLATLGKRLSVWDVEKRQRVGSGPSLRHAAHVAFSPDSSLLAAKSTTGELLISGREDQSERARWLSPASEEGPGPLFCPGGEFVLDATWSGDLQVREASTGTSIYCDHVPGTMITQLLHTNDRTVFFFNRGEHRNDGSWAERWFRQQWPLWDHEPIQLVDLPHLARDGAVTQDGSRIAVFHLEHLQVYDLGPAGRAQQTAERRAGGGTPDVLTWSPDGRFIAHSGQGAPHVYSSELTPIWSTRLQYACAAQFSPNGQLLALGSWSKGVCLQWPPKDLADVKRHLV